MVTIRRPNTEPEINAAAAKQFKTAVSSKTRLKALVLKPLIDHIKSDTRNGSVIRVGAVAFRKRVRFITKEVRSKWTLEELKLRIREEAKRKRDGTLTSVSKHMSESKDESEYGNRYRLITVNVIEDTLPAGLDRISLLKIDPKHEMQSYEPENGRIWATADSINKDLMRFMRLFKINVQRDLGIWRPNEKIVRELPEKGRSIHYDKIRGHAFMVHVKPKITTDHDNIIDILDSVLNHHEDISKLLEKIHGKSIMEGVEKFLEIEGNKAKTIFKRLLDYIKGLEREKTFGVDVEITPLE